MNLQRYREKWREVPAGYEGRVFSDDLKGLSDDQFLVRWEVMAAKRATSVVGQMDPLYRDFFANRRVLEIGGGLGFDGMRFAAQGAKWTFADIVPGNLAAIRRVAALKGIEVATHQITEALSFDGLPEFDAIMVVGSIHHVPFDIARREALDALKHLKIGGRWIELVYPRERWVREGSMPFDTWGTRTDGERTPWVEWYDAEKVRHRLRPAKLTTIFDLELAAGSYRWLDLRYDGMGRTSARFAELTGMVLDGGRREGAGFSGLSGAFYPIGRIDLGPIGLDPPFAVDLVIEVTQGLVGVGFVDENNQHLADSEIVLSASPDAHHVTLRSDERPAFLVFRNRHDERGSALVIRSARLREG